MDTTVLATNWHNNEHKKRLMFLRELFSPNYILFTQYLKMFLENQEIY